MHMSITLTCLAYAHVHERVDHACLQPGHTSLHMPIMHAIMRWIKGEQACIPRGGAKKNGRGMHRDERVSTRGGWCNLRPHLREEAAVR